MRKRGKALPSRPIFNEDNRGWSKLDAKRDTNISTFHDRHSTRLDSTRKQSRRVSGGKSGSRIVTRARQDAREPTFPLFCGMRVRFFTASSCRIAFIVRTRSDPLRKKKNPPPPPSFPSLPPQGPDHAVQWIRIITHNRGIGCQSTIKREKKKEKIRKGFPLRES